MFIGFEQIAVDGSTVHEASELDIPAQATSAQIQAGAGDIMYTMDESAPGGSRGMVLETGNNPIEYLIEDIRRIRFCGANGAAASHLKVHYFCGRQTA